MRAPAQGDGFCGATIFLLLFLGIVGVVRFGGEKAILPERVAPWPLYCSTQYLGFRQLSSHEAFAGSWGDTRRFAIVGGSSAQGAGPDFRWSFYGRVDYRDRCSIAYALSQRLSERRPERPVKVFNLAVNGAGVRTLTLLTLRAIETEPYGILLFVEPGTFLADEDFHVVPEMNRDLATRLEALNAPSLSHSALEKFRLRLLPAPAVTTPPEGEQPGEEWVARVIAGGLWALIRSNGGPAPVEMRRTPEYLVPAAAERFAFLAQPGFRQEGFEAAIERNLGPEMLEIVRVAAKARGVKILAVIPWSRFAGRVPEIYDRLRRLLQAAGMAFVDFSDAPLGGSDLSYDVVHLTVLGNRRVADIILASRPGFFEGGA